MQQVLAHHRDGHTPKVRVAGTSSECPGTSHLQVLVKRRQQVQESEVGEPGIFLKTQEECWKM